MLGFLVLGDVILSCSWHAVLIWTSENFRRRRKITVRRRRWSLPFQSGGLPGIVRFDILTFENAVEQIDDERNLRYAQRVRRKGYVNVEFKELIRQSTNCIRIVGN